MNNISLFTTTYHNDFDLLDRLLTSIVKYVGTDYKHYIILNDDIAYIEELNNLLDRYPGQQIVIHYNDFEEFKKPIVENCYFGDRSLEGWVIQIMLTLLVARKIDTKYYLHLCSKDFFTTPVDIQQMIVDNKTKVPVEQFAPFQPQFYEFFENACNLFGVNSDSVRSKLIAPQTPIMNNSKLVNKLLDDLDQKNLNIIDIIGINHALTNCKNKTIEYYLYSAWLATHNLTDDSLVWFDPVNNPCRTQSSYNLRREN